MQRLLGVAFAILLAAELSLLVVVLGLLAVFPYLLWQRSPLRATLAVLGLAIVGVALWRAHHADTAASSQELPGHPEISISHISISGAPGAIYMLQFLVWALVTPAVGFFDAALIAGALLLLPLIFYLNQPGRGSASAVGVGGVLGALCGLAVVAFVSFRELPLAGVFLIALAAGILGAPMLIWLRSRRRHVSIAPYSEQPR